MACLWIIYICIHTHFILLLAISSPEDDDWTKPVLVELQIQGKTLGSQTRSGE